MRKFLLLAVMTCFGVLTSQTTQAQEFVTINYTAEVTGVSAAGNIGDQVKESDIVIGKLVFQLDLAPQTADAISARFNLNEGANSMSATINGLEFETKTLEQPSANTPGFTASVSSWVENIGERDSCGHSISFISGHNTFPGDLDPRLTLMQLTFQDHDCDGEKLALDKLPGSIDLDRFENSTLMLRNSNRMDGYAIQAKITSVFASTEDGGTIKGQVVSDYDGDCQLDAEDFGLRQRILRITPGPYYAATDAEGNYDITLPVGKYKVHANERSVWRQVCPTGPGDAEIVNKGDEAIVNFNMEPKTLTEAISVHVMSSLARPGFEMTYTIRIQNTGTLPYTGDVTFKHDALLTDFVSEPSADSYADQTAVWSLEDFPVDGLVVIKITLKVPADETLLGTTICAQVDSDLEDKGNDEVLRESNGEVCQEIRGAYDPNDMQVFVGTRNADGDITQDDNILRYLIRFQNEGNEDAITVRIEDALSEFHNISKIRIGATSHDDFEFNFTEKGELSWNFENINLPPKEQDENASMGFVSFDIHLTDDLPIGTEIPNSAAIFFDFNSPIITNTVISRIASTTTSVDYDQEDTSIMVFPNPSTDKVTVKFDNARSAVLSLRNTLGETVLSQTVNGVTHVMNVQSLAAGNYYLTISDGESITVKPLNIVR